MKSVALLLSGGLLAGGIIHQASSPSLPDPLATDLTKLSSGKSFKAHFKGGLVGEPAKTYSLELEKDNKFKLTSDDGFVLSDGTNVWVYKKASNSYTQKPFSAAELQKFEKRTEVLGWEAFFQDKPGSDIASAVVGQPRKVSGSDVDTVDVALAAPEKRSETLFLDSKLGLVTGFEVKNRDKVTLIIADETDLSSKALDDKDFAFVPPSGAMLVQESDSGFAAVQKLMTDSCMPCHSSDHKRAGVDLSSYDGIVANVKPGDSAKSLLVKAVKGDGVDLMPKGRAPLTDDQIAILTKWIEAGAKDE